VPLFVTSTTPAVCTYYGHLGKGNHFRSNVAGTSELLKTTPYALASPELRIVIGSTSAKPPNPVHAGAQMVWCTARRLSVLLLAAGAKARAIAGLDKGSHAVQSATVEPSLPLTPRLSTPP
jgi:hypothetical protein